MADDPSDRYAGLRIVSVGDTVVFHGADGDVEAELLGFKYAGAANLRLPDGSELLAVPEGLVTGCWSR